ncbi:hypothetical protein HYV74_04820 [Candidatus Uhrbacteria bacterium]|nr:hypothetical protein [Candidatus Uhrbacteria bacterium]
MAETTMSSSDARTTRPTLTIPELAAMLENPATPHDIVAGLLMQIGRRKDDGSMTLLMRVGDETRQATPALWDEEQRLLARQVLVRQFATDKSLLQHMNASTKLLVFFTSNPRHVSRLNGQDLHRLAEFIACTHERHTSHHRDLRQLLALLAMRIGYYEFLTSHRMLMAIPMLFDALRENSPHLRTGTGALTWDGWQQMTADDEWERRFFSQEHLRDMPGSVDRLREDLWRIQVRAGIALAPQELSDRDQVAGARCLMELAAIIAHDVAPFMKVAAAQPVP